MIIKKIILTFIAVGLLYNFQISTNSLFLKAKERLNIEISIKGEFSKERTSDNKDDERKGYEFDSFILSRIINKLTIAKIKNLDTLNLSLTSFIAPVFTPPPDIISY